MSDSSIPAFPLAWPAGWPRTLPGNRKEGKFFTGSVNGRGGRSITVADGVTRVVDEFKRYGVPDYNLILSTNVRPTLSGWPRSGEPQPADPGVAVYWTEGEHRRVMAIDIYRSLPDNLGAVAATLAAMRAIERHGGAQILERAFTGFTALPAPGDSQHWRDILEYGNSAPERDAITRHYRIISSRAHPDKGGSDDYMAAVNRARDEALREVA